MSIRLRPLAFALVLAGLSAQASATDLVQAYDLARQSDPQFSAAEAQKNATAEGTVQSRTHDALRALRLELEEMGVGA